MVSYLHELMFASCCVSMVIYLLDNGLVLSGIVYIHGVLLVK